MCSPTRGKQRRRRSSLMPGRLTNKAAELPLGQDVINSLPPLCFPGKNMALPPPPQKKTLSDRRLA